MEAILRSVSLPLRFGRLLPACSGRSCLPPTCGCGKSPTALGYSHAVGVGESGHELGSTAARPAATACMARRLPRLSVGPVHCCSSSATPQAQPRCSRPHADRCHRSPRPPPGAIRESSRIYGARHIQRAAARPAATAWRAASRRASGGRASAHGRIFDAAAEAPAEACNRSSDTKRKCILCLSFPRLAMAQTARVSSLDMTQCVEGLMQLVQTLTPHVARRHAHQRVVLGVNNTIHATLRTCVHTCQINIGYLGPNVFL